MPSIANNFNYAIKVQLTWTTWWGVLTQADEKGLVFVLRVSVVIAMLFIALNAFVLYVLTPLQDAVLPDFDHIASLVFLPHGLKIFATILLRFKAVPGLVAGAAVSTPMIWGIADPQLIVILSLIGGVTCWIVLELLSAMRIQVFYSIDQEHLPPLWHILMAGLLCSVANGFLMDAALKAHGYENQDLAFLAFVIGDCAGLVVAWVLAKGGLDLLRKKLR